MTDTPTTDQQIGEALGRISRATSRILEVTTDGTGYSPRSMTATLAADLGFAQPSRDMTNRMPTVEDIYPAYVRDADRAAWQRRWDQRLALRVIGKAGADPADVAVLRTALGIAEEDESGWDHLDELNEQTRLHWLQRGAAHYAHAVAYAHDQGRQSALDDLQVIAASGLLRQRNGDTAALSADVHDQAEMFTGRDVTALDQALVAAKDGETLTVAGTLASVTKRVTQQGRDWASAKLVDGSEIELLLFPNTYERLSRLLTDGVRVQVTGRYDSWGGLPRLMVEDVAVPPGPVARSDDTESPTSQKER